MRELKLSFSDDLQLIAALRSAATDARLSHPEIEKSAGIVQAVISHADRQLRLFAQAGDGELVFTDELTDLRFQVERFVAEVGLSLDAVTSAGDDAGGGDEPDAAADGWDDEEVDEDVSDEDMEEVRRESKSEDPVVEEFKRIKLLPTAKKIRLAEEGSITQRNILFRMYGKLVYEGLLRNPRITEPEVAKLAKLGTLPPHLFMAIAKRPDWLRSERIRTNLLANPRTPSGIVQRIVGKLSKQELRPLLRRRDFPPGVQAALKAQNAKLLR